MDLSSVFTVAALGAGAAAAFFAVSAALSSVYTVKQKEEALITRFGAKHVKTTTQPGVHLKAPWPIHMIAAKVQTDLQQVGETLETKTKDELFVKLPITIQYEVNNTGKFYFDNRTPVDNMKKAVSNAVRAVTSSRDFQELYGDREEISNQVIEHIKSAVNEYGINIRRIIIDEPQAPEAMVNASNEVRASERLKEAARNKAEAHKIEVIAKAEADRQADILRGQGKAGFREAIFDQYSAQIKKLESEGIGRDEAVSMMIQTMQQDTLRDIGDKGNMVIVTDGTNAGTADRIAELQTLRRSPAGEQNNARTAPAKPAAPGI